MNGVRRRVRFWMQIVYLPVVTALIQFSAVTSLSVAQDALPKVVVQTQRLPNQTHPGIEVTGLESEVLAILTQLQKDDQLPPELLQLFVDGRTNPVLGKLLVEESRLILAPRFELQRGTDFVAVFHFEKLRQAASPVEFRFAIPPVERPAVAAQLTDVYPSSDELPRNVLRMYLQFATPMARGRAYDHVGFLDEDGGEIEEAYIPIAQELWSPDGKRLTILFDPGRIKRGLARNEELGTPFQTGQTVTLVVRPGWPDASGTLVEQEFRKSFLVTEPERSRPSISQWNLELPSAGSREPLFVHFDRPFDFALLQHTIRVTGDSSKQVSGTISVGEEEASVSFFPDETWTVGEYCLVVDPQLEDRSGNSLKKSFEIDVDSAADLEPPLTTRTFFIRK